MTKIANKIKKYLWFLGLFSSSTAIVAFAAPSAMVMAAPVSNADTNNDNTSGETTSETAKDSNTDLSGKTIDKQPSTTNSTGVQDTRSEEPDKGLNTKNLVDYKETTSGVDITFIMRYSFSSEYLITARLVDKLEPPFKVSHAKVLDKNLKDITNQGKLTVHNNEVTWSPNEPKQFSYATVYLKLTVSVPKNANLSKYKQSDGSYKIPNDTSLVENGKEYKSNKVQVRLPKDAVHPAELPATGRGTPIIIISLIIIAIASGFLYYAHHKGYAIRFKQPKNPKK